MRQSSGFAVLPLVVLWAGPTRAADQLTIDRALALARERAPALLAARERIEEARARLAGASVLLPENPVVDAAAGPRRSPTEQTTDVDVAVRQGLDVGGRRGARIAMAAAGLRREEASVDDERRRLLRDVAVTFSSAVGARDRRDILRRSVELADALLGATVRRYDAGDVAALDLNASRMAAARARAELRRGEAERLRRLAELRVVLGLDAGEPLTLEGSLAERPRYDLATLLSAVHERADLRALAADVHEAQAEERMGDGLRWPGLGVLAGYKHEERADIPFAGLSVSLPIVLHGQEERAVGAARARRLRLLLDAASRAAEVEVRAAYDAYRLEVEAVAELERDAMPLLDDSESLASRSYQLGELSLPELLLLRRELLETRETHLSHLEAAALARWELESQAGVLR